MFTQRTEKVPDEDASENTVVETEEPSETTGENVDDDEAVVEDVVEGETKEPEQKTKTVVIDEWVQLNPQPPIWMRFVFFLSLHTKYLTKVQ